MYVSTEKDHPAYKPSFRQFKARIVTPDEERIIPSWLVVNEEEGYVIVRDESSDTKRKIVAGKVSLCPK